ncbi:MAG: helix-turn-helix transcriptional regulator [Planctomycetia bacterium]|nr:helix-turn-helix transcriptional regulator [Planctomycetia bacterium]
MEKSIHTTENDVFRELLRETRSAAQLTQIEVGERLGKGQSFVSKVERGEIRLDVIQLRTYCHAINTTLPAFSQRLESLLTARPKRRKP